MTRDTRPRDFCIGATAGSLASVSAIQGATHKPWLLAAILSVVVALLWVGNAVEEDAP